MKSPWLLLDVSYLAYRTYYAIGRLSHGNVATTVIYGVLRDVLALQETFNTHRVAWCFDLGRPLRTGVLPTYKSSRHANKTAEEKVEVLEVRTQVCSLRSEYLTTIGFKNILHQQGYEADDIIAKVIADHPDNDFVIVSSDHDLYQLLDTNVSIWNPSRKEIYSLAMFHREFGIKPNQWPYVKAIAGCSSDDVPGIGGVGELTAAKYLRGEFKDDSKTTHRISENTSLIDANLKLVTLPYPGMEPTRLLKDKTTPEGWRQLIDQLGMNSLAGSIPGIPRRTATGMTRATLGFGKK